MDDNSTDRYHLDDVKESVFRNCINLGKKYFNSICDHTGKSSAWTQFWQWFESNKDNKSTDRRVSEPAETVTKPDTSTNFNEAVCKWELTCCEIKMQDPCGPCCCGVVAHQERHVCPHGLQPRKKQTCGCDKRDTVKCSVCDQCKIELERA